MQMRSQRCLEMEQPIYANSAKSASNPTLARVGGVRLERRLAVGVATKQKTKQTATTKKSLACIMLENLFACRRQDICDQCLVLADTST